MLYSDQLCVHKDILDVDTFVEEKCFILLGSTYFFDFLFWVFERTSFFTYPFHSYYLAKRIRR